VCEDASQGFYYSEVLQSQKIFSSLSAVRTSIYHCSIRPDSRQTKHHPFGRRVSPSGPSTVSRRVYPACIYLDVSAACPDASQYLNSLRFFPSSNNGKIDQPSRRCGISSGLLTAVVGTRVHQRRKLPIRLQPSGRLPIMVRTRALQIWKLRVEE
jgi:hypothetical protein